MDINTIVKTANAALAASAVTLIAVTAYCNKKQKQLDDIIYSERSFVRGGVRFVAVKLPSEETD